MSDKELEEYINKIEPNFNSHLEKGTIEMSNEYYNLLEEKMVRLINKNQELKKQLEEKNKPQIFIDTQDIEERYAEGLYQDYLEEENKKYKNQQKEFINYINSYIELLKDKPDLVEEGQKDILDEILSKYKEIINKLGSGE